MTMISDGVKASGAEVPVLDISEVVAGQLSVNDGRVVGSGG